jgi:hypothetical protein
MADDRRWRPIVGIIVAALIALAIGYRVAHSTGLRVVAVGLVAIALIALRLSVVGARRDRGSREAPDRNADFPRYRYFVSALRFASNRRYDLDRATRPPVVRLFGRVLAERHEVRIATERVQARELMGESAWSLVEVTRHLGPDAPGMSRGELEGIVSKLEELSL